MEKREIEYSQEKNIFSMTCRVQAKIHAKPEEIWQLLTDAKSFSHWNSTVIGIDGNIRQGERIRIHVPGTSRTFKPKVSDVVENKMMVWSDGVPSVFKGIRRFTLRICEDELTEFIMEERFSGFVFALIKNKLPDFKPIFETYALDLKNEAEKSGTSIFRNGYPIVAVTHYR